MEYITGKTEKNAAMRVSKWEVVGQGRDTAGVTKKCMWKEKVELHWRIQGHKERTEL